MVFLEICVFVLHAVEDVGFAVVESCGDVDEVQAVGLLVVLV